MIPRPFNRNANSRVYEAKYSYTKQILGDGEKQEILLKSPHSVNMKKYMLARKFLSMNYIYRSKLWLAKREFKTLDEWNETVKKLGQLPPSQKYTFRSMKVRRRNKPASTDTHPLTSPAPVVAEETSETSNVKRIGEEDAICDYQNLSYQVGGKDVFDAELKQQELEETEEWQCRHWRPKIRKDYRCFDVMEIIASSRVAALTINEISSTPNLNAILMENIRYAIYTHQWRLALKGVEGLCEEITTWNKCWLMWNGGFLVIINLFKNDIQKVLEYATYTRDFMFCYPRRLGIEVACWLIQKGYFMTGYQTVEEWHQISGTSKIWDFRWDKANSKRQIIDLIAILIKAVFQYSCWKRDTIRFNEGTYNGDEFSLQRSGETALMLFEELIPLSKLTHCDVTIFIEPLIELLIEYRDILEVKDIVKDLVIQNFGNGVLEGSYLKFLQTYFPCEEEINLYSKRLERFSFQQPSSWRRTTKKENAKIRFYIAQKYKRRETIPLSLKKKPSFSW